ncbi:polyketide cyclase [Thioclava sp. BHET1]|nr:polyketide cyclase [Thioclava sp. BHET1]
MNAPTKSIADDTTATFTYVVHVKGTPQAIFDALTIPDQTARFWGTGNLSDWQPGSRWQHMRADGEGQPELVGEVIENGAPARLVITWANASDADNPAAYSRVAFDIEAAADDRTKLTLTHSELDPEGGMLKGITQGSPVVLSGLKTFVETGSGFVH